MTYGTMTYPLPMRYQDSAFTLIGIELDRFITNNFWSTYSIVCGSAFAILGAITMLTVV